MLNDLFKHHKKEEAIKWKKIKKETKVQCKYCPSENTIIVQDIHRNTNGTYNTTIFSICKRCYVSEITKKANKDWQKYYNNQKTD